MTADSADPGELTEDRLLGGRVHVMQPRVGFRAAIDPVFLAAAVAARPGERVIEAGTGPGTAALCLLARVSGVAVTALERDPGLAALAARNGGTNGVADRLTVVAGDLLAPPQAIMVPGGYEWAMANPPYLKAGDHTAAADARKAAAVGEGAAGVADWVKFLWSRLRPGGAAVLIHRADRLPDVLATMAARFGDLALLPLWPKADRPAKRFLIGGRRDRGGPLRLLPGLVLHHPDGTYTEAAEAVLRHGAALPLWPAG